MEFKGQILDVLTFEITHVTGSADNPQEFKRQVEQEYNSGRWIVHNIEYIDAARDSKLEDGIVKRMQARLAADFVDILCGPQVKQPRTALRAAPHSYYGFEVVELDDAGNIVEPPKPCPNCGPVLACSKHFTVC